MAGGAQGLKDKHLNPGFASSQLCDLWKFTYLSELYLYNESNNAASQLS